MTQEEYIKEVSIVHNNFYDYSKTKYINAKTNVEIEYTIHGSFKQKPYHHLQGEGCPSCRKNHSENLIYKYLKEKDFVFEREKEFKDCVYKKPLKFDFYLPTYNCCIEYDGEQHFRVHKIWGEEKLKITQLRDNIKTKYCKNKKIKLFRIKYNENIIEKINNICESFKI